MVQEQHQQAGVAGYRQTRSAQDGSFCFGHFDPRGGAVRFLGPPNRLRFENYDRRCYETVAPVEPVPIGTTDCTVVVRSIDAVAVQVTVVDPAGKPVERFAWSCAPVLHVRDETRLLGGLRLSRELDHQGGVARRDDLLPGSHVLVVEPEDGRLARKFGQRFEVPANGPCKVRVQLDWRTSLAVRVADARGIPVAGVRVELLQGLTPTRWVSGIVGVEDFLNRGFYGSHPTVRLADLLTDEKGTVHFETATASGVAAIRVTGSDYLPRHVRIAVPPTTADPLEITLHRGAVLDGVIEPGATVLAWGPTARDRARFAPLADRQERLSNSMPKVTAVEISQADKPRRLASIAVGEDGTFRYGSVPPGSWRLILSYDHGRHDLTLGEVVGLRAGETRHIEFSIEKLTPGSLRGTALLDGVRVASGKIRMSNSRADVQVGGFEFSRLLAGRYWPVLELGNGRRLLLGRSVEVQPGQSLEPTFFFTRRRLVLRILDRDGKPLPGRAVSLRIREPEELNDWTVWRPEETDADGRVVFDPAPPFPVDVRVCKQRPATSDWWRPDVVNARSTSLGPVPVGAVTQEVVELVLRD